MAVDPKQDEYMRNTLDLADYEKWKSTGQLGAYNTRTGLNDYGAPKGTGLQTTPDGWYNSVFKTKEEALAFDKASNPSMYTAAANTSSMGGAPVSNVGVAGGGQDYINKLKEAQLRQKTADLQNAYNKNISSLNSEKSALGDTYTDKRNQTSTASQLQAKNFAEYLAARGQTNSGMAGQSELNRTMTLQNNIGVLNRQETQNAADIERRRSDLATALEQDKISAASGIEAQALQNLINQYNADRSYNYQQSRDTVADSQWNKTFDYNKSKDDKADNQWQQTFDYNKSRDAVGDQRYADETAYNRGRDKVGDSQWQQTFDYNKGQDTFNNNLSLAQILGTYNGKDTLAKQAQTWGQNIDLANLTGNYNGQRTIAGQQADDSHNNAILQQEAQVIANKFQPQILQGQIDGQSLQNAYQTMVNANYPKEQAAQISLILAQTQGVKLDNAAQVIANKYAPQIAQGQIDGQKLQNAYQKLVNAGYNAAQAADIAAKYANISQGWAQIDVSRQNANTSAAAQAWAQNPKNPDNIYKNAQIEKIQSGVSGSASSMTTKQIGDAKVKIAQNIYNQTGVVPTQAEIDSAFTSLYGTSTKPTTLPQNTTTTTPPPLSW